MVRLIWVKPPTKREDKPAPEKATVCAPALVLRGSTRQSSKRAHHLTRPPFAAARAQALAPAAPLISWDATITAITAAVPIVVALFGYLITREIKLVSYYFGEKHTTALATALAVQSEKQNQFAKEQTAALNAQGEKQNQFANAQTAALNLQNKELIAAMAMLKADAFDHNTRTTMLESERSMPPAACVAAAPARQMHYLRPRLPRFSAISMSARRLASLARRLA